MGHFCLVDNETEAQGRCLKSRQIQTELNVTPTIILDFKAQPPNYYSILPEEFLIYDNFQVT